MVALAMGELCAPPTAVGGAARHKHRSVAQRILQMQRYINILIIIIITVQW